MTCDTCVRFLLTCACAYKCATRISEVRTLYRVRSRATFAETPLSIRPDATPLEIRKYGTEWGRSVARLPCLSSRYATSRSWLPRILSFVKRTATSISDAKNEVVAQGIGAHGLHPAH